MVASGRYRTIATRQHGPPAFDVVGGAPRADEQNRHRILDQGSEQIDPGFTGGLDGAAALGESGITGTGDAAPGSAEFVSACLGIGPAHPGPESEELEAAAVGGLREKRGWGHHEGGVQQCGAPEDAPPGYRSQTFRTFEA